LETYLLARHLAIDAVLERAIERHRIAQVVEIAAGLSPRGWRFANRYGDRLTYVEADLPAMAERKRRALRRIGSLSETHRVREVDVLSDDGLGLLAAELDSTEGLVIITEGLLGYLPTAAVVQLWEGIAGTLSAFAAGRYISDLHLGSATSPLVRVFRVGLGAFVRGRVYLHFDDAGDAEDRLRASGFATAAVRPAARLAELPVESRGSMAHILEASTT
jgi:O-methyltransferase involved in polyketide biosynthesis